MATVSAASATENAAPATNSDRQQCCLDPTKECQDAVTQDAALICAATEGHADCMRRLIAAGAGVYRQTLVAAAAGNSVTCLRLALLRLMADKPGDMWSQGCQPVENGWKLDAIVDALYAVIDHGNRNNLVWLLDPDCLPRMIHRSSYPNLLHHMFHQAVRTGKHVALQVIHDTEACRLHPITPRELAGCLELAAVHGHVQCGRLLIEWGAAPVDMASREEQLSEWSVAAVDMALRAAAHEGHTAMVESLLQSMPLARTAGARCLDDSLGVAARYGHYDCMVLIARAGGRDFDGALSNAAYKGHAKCMQLAVKLGAKEVDEALCAAAEGGHTTCMRLAIELGARDFGLARKRCHGEARWLLDSL